MSHNYILHYDNNYLYFIDEYEFVYVCVCVCVEKWTKCGGLWLVRMAMGVEVQGKQRRCMPK